MPYLGPSLLTKGIFIFGLIVIGSFYLSNKINIWKGIVIAIFYSVAFLYLEERLLPFPLGFCVRIHFRDTLMEQFYITKDLNSYLKSFLFALIITICSKLLMKGRKGTIFAIFSNLGVFAFIFFLNTVWNGFYQLVDIVDYLVYFLGIVVATYIYEKKDYFSTLEKKIAEKPKEKVKYGF